MGSRDQGQAIFGRPFYYFLISFYCNIVDLQWWSVSRVQQSESVLHIHIYIYVYSHSFFRFFSHKVITEY